jgi:transposase/transposase-like protein
MRKPYPSDLTDAQWEIVRLLIPVFTVGRPREVDMREVVNTILYLNRSGCQWDMLPHDLPAKSTVYEYFAQWRDDGTWQEILDALRQAVRIAVGKDKNLRAGSIDSQSVKASEIADDRAYDGGKKITVCCFSRKWRDAPPELYYNSAGVSPCESPASKNYTSLEKVAILRRHLIDRVPVSDLCDEHPLSPTLFYLWQKPFFENGPAAFDRKNAVPEGHLQRTITALRHKLQRKNEVVTKLMEEHIKLKKEFGEL